MQWLDGREPASIAFWMAVQWLLMFPLVKRWVLVPVESLPLLTSAVFPSGKELLFEIALAVLLCCGRRSGGCVR